MPTKPTKLVPALYGGIIIAVLSSVPGLSLINCLCCAGVMIGGVMAVYFYKNTLTPESSPLESIDGVQLGLIAGAFGAVIAIFLSALFQMMFGNVGANMALSIVDRLAESGNIPPEALDNIRRSIEQSMGEGFRFLQFIKNFIIHLILFPLFGLFGGLIGASIFKSKQPPLTQEPPHTDIMQ